MSSLTSSRRDEDRLAAIVQSSSDAIYAKSMDGTIVAWNASAVRLFGYTQDEALGSSARIEIDIVDVQRQPARAERDAIMVTPTLLKLSPAPRCRILGNLKNREALLSLLGVELHSTRAEGPPG